MSKYHTDIMISALPVTAIGRPSSTVVATTVSAQSADLALCGLHKVNVVEGCGHHADGLFVGLLINLWLSSRPPVPQHVRPCIGRHRINL